MPVARPAGDNGVPAPPWAAAAAKGALACRPPARHGSVTQLLLDISLARLLLTVLGAALAPVRTSARWVAWTWSLAVALRRWVLHCLGFLAAPPRSAALRRLGRGALEVRRWHIAAAGLLAASAACSAAKYVRDLKDEAVQQKRRLLAKMAASKSYFEWSIHASKLDNLEGVDQAQRWAHETRLYDRRLLREKAAHLRKVRACGGGVADQMFALRADLMRNLGNITNSALQDHFPVIPEPIREYIEEVKLQLEEVTHSPDLPLEEKSAFLKETRHAFGRTALVLSGGGSLGAFHLGVVKALLEHGMLPRVLAGSSVGSIVCALVATRTDGELQALLCGDALCHFDLSFFSSSTAPQFVAQLLSKGTVHDHDVLVKRLRHLLGDLTFMEAFQHTGRVLNVSVTAADTHEPPRLLNYLTAPHVVIWSAVACSSAFPGLFQPQELLARNAAGQLVKFTSEAAGGDGDGGGSSRRWRDGSLEQDLPLRGLSEMFSANHFIVSQTNPHIVPFLNLKRRLGTVGAVAESEFKHRCKQLGEVLPDWLPSKWLRVFSQQWEGDVTIVLPHTFLQLYKAVVNPSNKDLLAAVRQGELCTWAKLSAIHCNCGIEATLDACIQQVSTWERQERRKAVGSLLPLKSRIPSWVHLPGAAGGQLVGSPSQDSLAGFDNDGFYGDDDHLPLPEERANSYQVYMPPEATDCIDVSANAWAGMAALVSGGGANGAARYHRSTDRLDVIAP
ncbi:Triacylglycerol lipase SDP1 [Micractinium conductrix]|uniref:Triacylglycerol lipase SDP1 n=1 Tax=Micractinium conductrix TaxID=554055 RepID=A0A2P6VNL2_9CHLO|nr:Triacylglycerol lipase SDP1 [Micractinium conductrix]|eukprot:PSC75647.1 Triacylglycerol lipase SDP1 [Micractinium conductrix]